MSRSAFNIDFDRGKWISDKLRHLSSMLNSSFEVSSNNVPCVIKKIGATTYSVVFFGTGKFFRIFIRGQKKEPLFRYDCQDEKEVVEFFTQKEQFIMKEFNVWLKNDYVQDFIAAFLKRHKVSNLRVAGALLELWELRNENLQSEVVSGYNDNGEENESD